MNGATALDCEKTISRPNSTNTMTIGTSQYFFSSRRNSTNSDNTRPLLMATSKHAIEMAGVSIAIGIPRPPGPRSAAPFERIASDDPPDDAERRQYEKEGERQQHARVHPTEHRRERPPRVARILEQRRPDVPKHDEHRTDGANRLGARDATAPRDQRRD